MVKVNDIAKNIPHEYREKILMEWLPNSAPSLANKYFELLWEAWFLYVEPDGIKKPNCQICINGIFDNWKALMPALVAEEKAYNTLEQV